MQFDELDIKILKKFYELEKDEADTWKWASEFFPKEKSDQEKRKNYRKIIRRIDKMKCLFIIEENGERRITLDAEKVKFQKKRLPNGMKDCILINYEGYWNVFELS